MGNPNADVGREHLSHVPEPTQRGRSYSDATRNAPDWREVRCLPYQRGWRRHGVAGRIRRHPYRLPQFADGRKGSVVARMRASARLRVREGDSRQHRQWYHLRLRSRRRALQASAAANGSGRRSPPVGVRSAARRTAAGAQESPRGRRGAGKLAAWPGRAASAERGGGTSARGQPARRRRRWTRRGTGRVRNAPR